MAGKTTATNREIKNPFFKIRVGAMDKKNPDVIFIEGNAYISLNNSYDGNLKRVEKSFKQKIKKYLTDNPLFSKNCISIFDASESRLSLKQKTFLTLQYFLKQKKQLAFDELFNNIRKEDIDELFNDFQIILEDEGFTVSKTK